MIEDALGLKVYQHKRQEAEKKLTKTEENMRQAQALRKEIQPHLQHLKRLVDKFQKAAEIKSALEKMLKEYLGEMNVFLHREGNELYSKRQPLLERVKDLTKKIDTKRGDLNLLRSHESRPKELVRLEEERSAVREKRLQIERDLGRLEGMLEAVNSGGENDDDDVVSREEVENLLLQTEDTLSMALETDVIDEIHTIIQETIVRLNTFFSGVVDPKEPKSQVEELIKRRRELEIILIELNKKEKVLIEMWNKHTSTFYEQEKQKRSLEEEIMHQEIVLNELRENLRTHELEEEKLRLRRDEFKRELEDAKHYIKEVNIFEETTKVLSEKEREKIRREIDRLKFRFEEAGGVDSDVLKEFEETKERDTFFEKELADLGKSAKSLREISSHLNAKIENDFNKGVEKINKEFQRFFETMFGGGRARLYTIKTRGFKKTPEESEYDFDEAEASKEGGVEIDVSLPWKKIKGLDMLSGGERALTSIALLFAMTAVKPPPFLVLDETDAALDEANSRRYAEMLKKLSLTTQIITITHNRETMKQAGVLYGVTVGSDGVSRLLSLKLSEAENLAQ